MNKTNQINNYFQVYLQEAECAKCLSKKTLVGYSEVIQTFLNIMPELSLLQNLSPNITVEFYKRLHRRAHSENREIKTSTIYTYHSKLNVFFGWLEHQGYIQKEVYIIKYQNQNNQHTTI